MCGDPAVAKVGEEIMHDDPNHNRHNFTAYLCEPHARWVLFGDPPTPTGTVLGDETLDIPGATKLTVSDWQELLTDVADVYDESFGLPMTTSRDVRVFAKAFPDLLSAAVQEATTRAGVFQEKILKQEADLKQLSKQFEDAQRDWRNQTLLAVQEAVEKEREACAQCVWGITSVRVEGMVRNITPVLREAAKAIRSRSLPLPHVQETE